MKYNLWDTEISRYLGYFEDERKALELVRMLLDHHGDDYADDLGLGRVTDEDEILEPLAGAALIARVNEVFPEREGADQGRGAAIAS